MPLLIHRHRGQKIRIDLPDGRKIWLAAKWGPETATFAFRAPRDIKIYREEIAPGVRSQESGVSMEGGSDVQQ